MNRELTLRPPHLILNPVISKLAPIDWYFVKGSNNLLFDFICDVHHLDDL
jgi:hypothetical protein